MRFLRILTRQLQDKTKVSYTLPRGSRRKCNFELTKNANNFQRNRCAMRKGLVGSSLLSWQAVFDWNNSSYSTRCSSGRLDLSQDRRKLVTTCRGGTS